MRLWNINMAKQIPKWIYWTPRILSIIFLLFLALFSLDVFDSCKGIIECALALFMHNIPVFIFAIILIISWKYEIVGGIAFILGGLLYSIQVIATAIINGFEFYYLAWIMQISGIAFFIGILFLVNWHKKKR